MVHLVSERPKRLVRVIVTVSSPGMPVGGYILIGCDVGTLNIAKIKGSHTFKKSGMIAAEAVHLLLLIFKLAQQKKSVANNGRKEKQYLMIQSGTVY